MKHFALTLALGLAFCAGRVDAQTFATLVAFTGGSGTAARAWPVGSLTINGTTIYGMTEEGLDTGYGNVFSVGIDGSNYQNLLSLPGPVARHSAFEPQGSLTLNGSTVYGMTGGMPHSNITAMTTAISSAWAPTARTTKTLLPSLARAARRTARRHWEV